MLNLTGQDLLQSIIDETAYSHIKRKDKRKNVTVLLNQFRPLVSMPLADEIKLAEDELANAESEEYGACPCACEVRRCPGYEHEDGCDAPQFYPKFEKPKNKIAIIIAVIGSILKLENRYTEELQIEISKSKLKELGYYESLIDDWLKYIPYLVNLYSDSDNDVPDDEYEYKDGYLQSVKSWEILTTGKFRQPESLGNRKV